MIPALHRTLTAIALLLLATPGALAQPAAAPPSAGWTLTPSLGLASAWDDDVLLRGDREDTPSDLVSTVNPRAEIGFTGRRGQFAASYSGAFRMHRDLSTLNSYDQYGSLSARRTVSRRVALFVRSATSVAPTTELTELVGIPYARTGSTVQTLRGGAEAALSKRTSVIGAYIFQDVRFNERDQLADLLRGGHSNGASVSVRRTLTNRTTFTADYTLQHANVASDTESFTIQNASGGAEHALSETVLVYGAVGMSRVGVSDGSRPRTGPSVRAGLTRQFQNAAVALSYSRSFVPSFGFRGTTTNEEFTARLRVPLSRRAYTHGGLSWRRNMPLAAGELSLRSRVADVAVGYVIQRWAHVEAFFQDTSQTIDRPGGMMNRHRVGFQLVTTAPMRIR
jgi:hypothetical protein